jgi:uncharacterized delta-60 repeat protein
VTSILTRKRTSIALVSFLGLAMVGLPSAVGAAAGDLDPSFGTGGKVITDLGESDFGEALVLQPNGKLVVGGGNGRDFALVRYLPDGSPDSVFDLDGIVTTDFGRDESLSGLAFRPGQLVAAGSSISPLPFKASSSPSPTLAGAAFAVARYRLDGSLDPTFDGDGKVLTDFDGRGALAYDIAIQPDGKVVVVGTVDGVAVNDSDFAIARYNTDGGLDPTFGVGGLVITDIGTEDQGWAVSLQEDGRIVAAGMTGVDETRDFALARYNTDGSLDQSFDGDGKRTIDFGGMDFAFDVAIQSDSKIVVAGTSRLPALEFDFALARLNTDGSLDTEGLDPYMDAPFDTDGKVTTDFAGEGDQATSVAIEPSGKILVAGAATPAPGPELEDFGLARYNVDGSLDSDFGGAGKVTTSFSPEDDVPWGVVVQRDGRIVLAGSSEENGSFDFALARYLVRGCCIIDGAPPGAPEEPGPLPQ